MGVPATSRQHRFTPCIGRERGRRVRAALGWLAAALVAAGQARALNPARRIDQYGLDVWQIEQGLPQNSVRAVLQTRDGYLWLGTYEGLVRFDGVSFTVFNTRTTPALRNNGVLALHEDASGGLWITTMEGGLVAYDGAVFRDAGATAHLPAGYVVALADAPPGGVWLGLVGAGVLRVDGRTGIAEAAPPGLGSAQVSAVLTGGDGSLWVGTADHGLFHLANGAWSNLTIEQGLSSDHISALLHGRDGSLWVGTSDAGLSQIQGGRVRHLTTADGLAHARVASLCEDRDGNLWVGTNGGLSRLSGGMLTSLTTSAGLTDRVVMALCEDREGSLWIGTLGGGLNRLKDGSFVPLGMRQGLASADVRVIHEGRRGDIWVATESGVALVRGGHVADAPSAQVVAGDRIYTLTEDRRGRLWIGSRAHGLVCIDGGRIAHYGTKDGLHDDQVSAILERRDGSMWFGTRGGAVHRFDGGRFVPLAGPNGPVLGQVSALLESRDGALWIGTLAGLWAVEQARAVPFGGGRGLASRLIFSLYEYRSGDVWVGTYGDGLFRYRAGAFSALTMQQGLLDDVVYQTLEDDLGFLWLSSNNGISRVSLASLEEVLAGRSKRLECQGFDREDGMPSRECNGGYQGAGCRTRDGRLWFPTIRGVAIVDPAHLVHNSLPPPVRIEEVRVDQRSLPVASPLVLAPGSRSLEIRYAALSYLAPGRVRFSYRLEGFEPAPHDAGGRRVAYYTKLPPGTFRFHVTACNDDGVWNDEGAVLVIVQRPFFYQTKVFAALVTLAALAFSGAAFSRRVRRLKRRQRELEQLVDARTGELAAANVTLEAKKVQLEQANAMLTRLSFLDGLTAVANRRHFDEAFELEWRRASRSGASIALIIMDIDDFKAYNDELGHPQGDDCLRQVAGALAAGLNRAGDLLARYGGEEFVALLPGETAERAAEVAEKLRVLVGALALPHPRSRAASVVTLSLGVAAALPSELEGPGDLLAAADAALYRAKKAGRNRSLVAARRRA
ncbi:MAG: two-component regulator propeller domain-containing protein [Acidobacteriota bacterium]